MKKSLLLLPILLIGSTLSGISGELINTSIAGDPPILILPDTMDIPDGPRMPGNYLFIAEVMNNSGSILLEATYNIGIVYVEIVSTAGDDYSTYFNTAIGAIYLPLSGNSGNYTLTITTIDGIHYVGEFTI